MVKPNSNIQRTSNPCDVLVIHCRYIYTVTEHFNVKDMCNNLRECQGLQESRNFKFLVQTRHAVLTCGRSHVFAAGREGVALFVWLGSVK